MRYREILNEIENILNEIEEQQNNCKLNGSDINSHIQKLLLVIETDNFNSAEAYNYCKILKELLIRKRVNDDLKAKYEMIMNACNSNWIRRELAKKEKVISEKTYTARVFKKDEAITEYLIEDKSLLLLKENIIK